MKRIDHRCEKLILLNSNFWEDNSLKKIDRRRVAELVQTKKEAFVKTAIPNLFMDAEEQIIHVKALIKDALKISVSAIAKSSIAMSERRDNTAIISERPNDVLIIQGQFDSTVSQKMMRERIKGLGVLIFELPCGHMAYIEQSKQVEDTILKFLK